MKCNYLSIRLFRKIVYVVQHRRFYTSNWQSATCISRTSSLQRCYGGEGAEGNPHVWAEGSAERGEARVEGGAGSEGVVYQQYVAGNTPASGRNGGAEGSWVKLAIFPAGKASGPKARRHRLRVTRWQKNGHSDS